MQLDTHHTAYYTSVSHGIAIVSACVGVYKVSYKGLYKGGSDHVRIVMYSIPEILYLSVSVATVHKCCVASHDTIQYCDSPLYDKPNMF